MKLYIKQNDIVGLDGSGDEYKQMVSLLMSHAEDIPSFIKDTSIVEFYQSLMNLSSQDKANSLTLLVQSSVLEWYFHVIQLLPNLNLSTLTFINELEQHYQLLKKGSGSNNSLIDSLCVHYHDALGVSTIKRMAGFMLSFQMTQYELNQLIIGKFLEAYPSVKVEGIRLDMYERMYHFFFENYQDLMTETHLIFPLPLFIEKLEHLYKEENLVGRDSNESFLWSYLLYWDMFQKGLADGFVYKAEDSEQLFEWFRPLFVKLGQEKKTGLLNEKEWERKNREKDMMEFRKIYIQELSRVFEPIEKIEDDEEIPYNVVFILKNKQRIVCNTLKHYEAYVDELMAHRKEETISKKDFIRKIAPVSNKNSTTLKLSKKTFEEVKLDIYPMIRKINSTPKEAVYTQFVEGFGVFYGIRIQDKQKTQYAMIMEKIVAKWQINNGVLYQTALNNLKKTVPTLLTYQDLLKKRMTKEQTENLSESYKEIYLLVGKSTIDSSYVLDEALLEQMKTALNSEVLYISIPIMDCFLVTKGEHLTLLKEISTHLHETYSAKLFPNVIKWEDGKWSLGENN